MFCNSTNFLVYFISSTGISGIIGGYLSGILSDRYGRRWPFLFAILIIAIFGVVSAFAPTFPLFIVFRCMVTIGNGVFETVGFVLLLGKVYYVLKFNCITFLVHNSITKLLILNLYLLITAKRNLFRYYLSLAGCSYLHMWICMSFR